MSEQDSFKSMTPSQAYNAGMFRGFEAVIDPDGYQQSHLNDRPTFARPAGPDQLQSVTPELASHLGIGRDAAIGLNRAVHNLLEHPMPDSPGKFVDARGSEVDGAYELYRLVDRALTVSQDPDLELLAMRPEVKEIIPQVAMTELYGRFADIHDVRVPSGITRQELQDYADHCGKDREMDKLVVDYALKHFDKIRQLDGDGAGITQTALEHGLKIFTDADKAAAAVGKLDPLQEKILQFFDANFDKIRDPKFPGIGQLDLRRYFSKNCNEDLERSVMSRFDQIRNLDPADGGRDWHYAWLSSNNSDDITRSDISTGLAAFANDRARSQAVQSIFEDWAK